MGEVYNIIADLCKERGITAAQMCREAGIGTNTMTELKSGRHSGLSAKKAQKIATYFGVSVGYLLGEEQPAGVDVLESLAENERALLHSYRTMTEEQKRMMEVFVKGIKNAD